MYHMRYPTVLGELKTLALVSTGKSIARYGDGEFKITAGGGCVSQAPDRNLTDELRHILVSPHPDCLVGIPTMDANGPKIHNWMKYRDKYPRFLSTTMTYHSAFITRPDSAPWIDTKEYFDAIEALWRGQEVTLVCNLKRSLKPEFLMATGAKAVHHVQCQYRDAYAEIDTLERLCRTPMGGGPPRRVLLCVGPTATCLAYRLAKAGQHAIDLGHIGLFWRAYERSG